MLSLTDAGRDATITEIVHGPEADDEPGPESPGEECPIGPTPCEPSAVDEAEFAAWCRANRAEACRPNEPARSREMDDAYDRLAARIWADPVTGTREERISCLRGNNEPPL